MWAILRSPHMTIDALLALLLSVGIPALLALAGGVLTVRTLNTHRVERWSWLTVFIFLFIAASVLGVVQQIRNTNAQVAAKDADAAREGRHLESERYTQGELDSINKVLTAVVSSGGGSNTYQSTMRALLSALPRTSSPQARPAINIAALSNTELKYLALDQVGAIREIEHRASQIEQTSVLNDMTYERAYQERRSGWEAIRQQCRSIKDELVKRLPESDSKPPPQQKDEN